MDHTIIQAQDLPDDELVAKILAGQKHYFEWIIRRYNQRLFRIGMSILNNDAQAEEAMQASYISAYEHLGKFEKRSSLSTWITRIMVNECLSEKKKQEKMKAIMAGMNTNPTTMTTPANILANRELAAILENAVTALPEKYRLVFVLREIEKLSIRDTALTLDIEEPNVKTRLNRAKTILRNNLNGYMQEQVYPFHLTRCNQIVAGVFSRLGII
jgi:RNA polymerase sigma factor (sigma-70 family)